MAYMFATNSTFKFMGVLYHFPTTSFNYWNTNNPEFPCPLLRAAGYDHRGLIWMIPYMISELSTSPQNKNGHLTFAPKVT